MVLEGLDDCELTMLPIPVSVPVYLLFCLLFNKTECKSEGNSVLAMRLGGNDVLERKHGKAQSIDGGAWVCVLYGYTCKTPQDRNKARHESN